jgi:cell wall-associated NlpC family hydrolase
MTVPHSPRRLRRALVAAVSVSALTASALLVAPGAGASPERIAEIEAYLNVLGMEEAAANEQVLTAEYEYAQVQAKIGKTEAKIKQAKSEVQQTNRSIGQIAASAYRSGGIDSSLQLLLVDDAQQFLDQSVVLDIVAGSQAAALRKGQAARLKLAQAEAELVQQEAQAATVLAMMEANKERLSEKTAATQAYLDQLKEEERQRLEEERKRREAESRAAAAAAAAALNAGGSSSGGSSSGTVAASGGPNDNGELTAGGGGYSGGSGVSSDRAAIVVAYALAQVGEPYVNTPPGARPPDSWDCTKLTAAAWAQVGVRLTPYSYVQAQEVRRISPDELQPGDLLFFFKNGAHHASMYIGGGMIVEASSPSTGVRVTNVWNSWNVAHFSWAGRPYG